MSNLVMVYTTWPSDAAARDAGLFLIRNTLAACVNIFPTVRSLYEWEGKIEETQECVMLIKTSQDAQEQVLDAVMALHPYDVPAFLVLPVLESGSAYEAWLLSVMQPS